jgi:hypothetical protein
MEYIERHMAAKAFMQDEYSAHRNIFLSPLFTLFVLSLHSYHRY